MSQQPAKEWDDMTAKELSRRDQILAEIRDSKIDVSASILRMRLVGGSRSGLAKRGI